MTQTQKTALVTGGTTGIGLATARALAGSGWRVFVTGRSQAKLDAATAEIEGLVGIQADMADLDGIKRLAARLAADGVTLDALVANAGTAEKTVFGQTSPETFDRTFDLNVRGVFFTVQGLLDRLADGSSVVLIGSIVSIKGMQELSVYNASKAAVRSFARSWANDLRDRRIRVNTLSPGPVMTPLVQELQGHGDGGVEAFEAWASQASPAGRVGAPEDIAGVVQFLTSGQAGYVNGVELFVDGGLAQI